MLSIDPAEENGQPFWLHRLMIEAAHQRRGYGKAALDVVVAHIRTLGAQEFYTSWVPSDTAASREAFENHTVTSR